MMKKLKLHVDALAVESFAAGDCDGPVEAVPANEFFATRPEACDPFSVPPRCS